MNFKTGFHISVKNVVGILTTYQFALDCRDEIHSKKQLGKKGFVSVSSLQSTITEGQGWNSRQKSEGGTKADVVGEHHLLACSPRLAFLYSSGTPCPKALPSMVDWNLLDRPLIEIVLHRLVCRPI